MKALSIRQPWAGLIFLKQKTIEIRSWKTNYRGDFVVCASRTIDSVRFQHPRHPVFCRRGETVCIAELIDCRPMTKSDSLRSMVSFSENLFAWELDNIRPLPPIQIQGSLSFFNVNI